MCAIYSWCLRVRVLFVVVDRSGKWIFSHNYPGNDIQQWGYDSISGKTKIFIRQSLLPNLDVVIMHIIDKCLKWCGCITAITPDSRHHFNDSIRLGVEPFPLLNLITCKLVVNFLFRFTKRVQENVSRFIFLCYKFCCFTIFIKFIYHASCMLFLRILYTVFLLFVCLLLISTLSNNLFTWYDFWSQTWSAPCCSTSHVVLFK